MRALEVREQISKDGEEAGMKQDLEQCFLKTST